MAKRHAPRGPVKAKPGDPMEPTDPMEARCTATNRQGQRCKKPPILGGTVCRMHGGAAPQVQDAAWARLQRLENPAITRLGKLIDQEEFPTVAFAASKDVLDRLRGKATERVEATLTTSVADMSDEELKERAIALLGLADAGG